MGLRMVLRLAPLLLVLGCAGSQSAFPLPPAFSPVEDAPITVGHPGYVTPEPERSPHKRVLPETPRTRREPGIWASDSSEPVGTLSVLGIPLPGPKLGGEDDAAAKWCATSMALALHDRADVASRLISRTARDRKCVVLDVYAACLDWFAAVEFRNEAKSVGEAIRRRERDVRRAFAAECGAPSDEGKDPEAAALISALLVRVRDGGKPDGTTH